VPRGGSTISQLIDNETEGNVVRSNRKSEIQDSIFLTGNTNILILDNKGSKFQRPYLFSVSGYRMGLERMLNDQTGNDAMTADKLLL